jgi:capsular polysaccharide biosynthesis protein
MDHAIYGGPLLPAYGHFLLESLARLWAAPSFPHSPIVWTVNSAQPGDHILPWMRESLDLLGLNNTVRLIREPTLIERLIVPAPGFEIQYRFGRHHSKFLARLEWTPVRNRKLWLSRSGVDQEFGHGRTMLETALVANGWTVIRPENMSLAEQLSEFATAERIAGEQGSALHGLIFLRPAPGLRLDVFARDPDLKGHLINANQATISARRRIDYRFHAIHAETIIERKGSRVSKHHAPPDAYMNRLAQA